MRVKICGIRTLEDARMALEAGAWAIGFVFHRPSKRSIDPDAAAALVRRLPEGALTVGVFVDWPLEELNRVVRRVGLRGAQLHGSEDPAYAARVEAATVIKALRVGPGFDPEELRRFAGLRILLDAHDPASPGGTGRSFDWSVARRAGEIAPVILAGGLGPGNLERALREARPDGVDVSSGVESAPGVKDPEKVHALFDVIRAWEGEGRRAGAGDSPPGEPPSA